MEQTFLTVGKAFKLYSGKHRQEINKESNSDHLVEFEEPEAKHAESDSEQGQEPKEVEVDDTMFKLDFEGLIEGVQSRLSSLFSNVSILLLLIICTGSEFQTFNILLKKCFDSDVQKFFLKCFDSDVQKFFLI